MYKFKHYDNKGKFLNEVVVNQDNYHYVTFPNYTFVNDVIDVYKIKRHILGTTSETFIKRIEL